LKKQPWERRFEAMLQAVVESATKNVKHLTQKGLSVDMRLYYKPSSDLHDGELLVCSINNQPDEFILASDDPFHGGIPYDEYPRWVRRHSGKLPILASGLN